MSRARAIAHQHSLDADDSGDDGKHGEEVDEKLAVRRAKNREAARRVRERRMNQIKTLSEQVAALTLENDRLKGLAARSSQQQAQPSPAVDALGSGAPRPGLSDHSANHTATPTQSQTQQRRSLDRDDHKDHADCGTPSDGSRTSDISGTNEAGVQTDVTMAAQDWSPRDIMQVMTLLTRSSLPDGLAGLQQEASSQQQQQQPQPQPNAQQLQKQLEQLQEQQRQQQQEQQQKEQKQKLQQQQQQQRAQVAQQHSDAMSPSASQGTTVSTVPGSHVQDQGQQTAQMPVPNAPFTLEQVQALLEAHSKLLAGQQPSPSNNTAQRASPSSAIPPPALQQPQPQQNKRGASSVLSPTSGAAAAAAAPQPRMQQAHQVQLKQEAPQVPPRQPTWQDLRLRSTDPASSISMVPWSQASNGPMGPSVVAAAQAAAALAAQGRSGSGGMLGGRSGSGQGDASTSFAPLMQQHQQMYANSTLQADMRQFNRSAGLLFSLDDNDATLMSTDGNLLSDMNLGLTSDMNLASEELLRHVPLPEDAAALGHTAWL